MKILNPNFSRQKNVDLMGLSNKIIETWSDYNWESDPNKILIDNLIKGRNEFRAYTNRTGTQSETKEINAKINFYKDQVKALKHLCKSNNLSMSNGHKKEAYTCYSFIELHTKNLNYSGASALVTKGKQIVDGFKNKEELKTLVPILNLSNNLESVESGLNDLMEAIQVRENKRIANKVRKPSADLKKELIQDIKLFLQHQEVKTSVNSDPENNKRVDLINNYIYKLRLSMKISKGHQKNNEETTNTENKEN